MNNLLIIWMILINARENAKAKRDYFVRYDTYDDINKGFASLKLKRRGTRK